MFKKKPNIKPLAPLRSSDRRKLADQIIVDLGLSKPEAAPDDATPEQKAEVTGQTTDLRNAILPENTQSARFTTTQGPDLKQVSGTVYVGSHQGSVQRVLWVKVGDRVWPTIYTLWHNPRIVPLLHTHEPVVAKLQSGADLMTPGLARGPPFPSKASPGTIVAIASTDKPSVPVVVGVCRIDVAALQKVQGEKGVAVEVLSWVGDEIWSGNPYGKDGLDVPASLDAWLEDDATSADQLSEQVNNIDLQGQPPAASDEHAAAQSKDEKDDESGRQWTTEEIDHAFHQAFLYGLATHKEAGSPPRYGLVFPLKPSFIMSALIQPYLPVFSPSDADALQMKKTSWKNMKKYLKHLDKKKPPYCWTKDQGGETNIFMLEFDHPEINSFQRYPLPKKSKSSKSSASTGEHVTDLDASVGQRLQIKTLHKPKEKHASLFDDGETRGYHTAAAVKEAVASYIQKENLVSPSNKRLVTLNPFLANSVIDGSKSTDREAIAKGAVARDALTERVLSSCSPYYVILRNGASVDSKDKPKAGAAPKIVIVLETRSGNKTVTKVSGLEAFFIPPQPLADELKKTCAGSTSVEQLAGSSPKAPVMEVMVQGPQASTVLAALEKRGVDKRWVDVVDKTKKKR